MPLRLANRTGQALVDCAVLAIAYACSFLLRFEGHVPPEMLRTLAWTLPYVVALQYGLILAFGVHRLAWRYIGLLEVRRIGTVIAVGTALLLVTRFSLPALLAHGAPWAVRAIIPLGIIVSFGLLAFFGTVSVRVLLRTLSERRETDRRTAPESAAVPTILIGAGRAGVLVAKEILARPDLGIVPVAFLDDDPAKVGTVVHGIPVVGPADAVGRESARRRAPQALITMASVPGKEIRRIAALCERAHVKVKIVPGLFEIVGGRINLSRIRPIAIDDLLRREPVTLDEDAILAVVRERVVMVTGAGGSIGSELCRQICRFAPREIVLVEHSENGLFHIERELRAQYPDLAIHALLADVRDKTRIEDIFSQRRPNVVFHAAAHKHVPMMEANPGEAIKNNVLGTKLLTQLADRYAVSEFVMISTDKAVNPTSLMGASKRAAELVVQAMSQRSKTRFVAVRFGNVLGSAGSVVPIFQEQLARGGPLTVTHPDMKRYFMTIPEACQLVLQAGAMGKGGEIFVLDMGEPVKIVDLARDLIALSGLREGEDVEITFTGIRPGEKLSEELSLAEEGATRTQHPKVYIGRIRAQEWGEVERHLDILTRAAAESDPQLVRAALRDMVVEYQAPASTGAPPSIVGDRVRSTPSSSIGVPVDAPTAS